MSDGAQGAGQDTPNHQICIKTWTCTLPDSLEEITPGQGDIAEQYTRFLDQLESGDGLRKHCVDFLAVSRATTIADYRWFSSASRISNLEIAKYTLTRRSEFIRQTEEENDLFDLDQLPDFHDRATFTEERKASRIDTHDTGSKPLHVYGRKSTAPRRQSTPRRLPNARLDAFRQLLQSTASSQEEESSHESIQASTPRVNNKRPAPQFDSPAVASAFVQSSEASSLSSSPSPPTVQTKTKLIQQEVKRIRLDREQKGRQPLLLQATTSALPYDPASNRDGLVSTRAKKGKSVMRPITRKIPANGILPPHVSPQGQKTLGKVISNARRLQAFGGSWPLKGKSIRSDDIAGDKAENGDSTEIIEDYTIHLDASSSPPEDPTSASATEISSIGRVNTEFTLSARVHTPIVEANSEENWSTGNREPLEANYPLDLGADVTSATSIPPPVGGYQIPFEVSDNAISITAHTTHTTPEVPMRSTNLPDPPSPYNAGYELGFHLKPGHQKGTTTLEGGNSTLPSPPCAQEHVYRTDLPEISVTLPTSSISSSSRASHQKTPCKEQDKTNKIGATLTEVRTMTQKSSQDATMAQFLSLAFGSDAAASSGQYYRHVLPSRCIPAFRILSKPITASPIAKVLVSASSLHNGGLFGRGYLGPGRRGFWQLPLTSTQMPDLQASQGVVLGLCPFWDVPDVRPRRVIWTLQRLQYLLTRLKDLARLGKFGVVTVATTGNGGAEAIEICCQASMALMLRAVLSELRCPVDSDGNEVCEVPDASSGDGGHHGSGSNWLGSDKGVRLVWWDEVERRPILLS